jgi:hypothetical protein
VDLDQQVLLNDFFERGKAELHGGKQLFPSHLFAYGVGLIA